MYPGKLRNTDALSLPPPEQITAIERPFDLSQLTSQPRIKNYCGFWAVLVVDAAQSKFGAIISNFAVLFRGEARALGTESPVQDYDEGAFAF